MRDRASPSRRTRPRPRDALAIGAPSVRRNAFGGSDRRLCQVRNCVVRARRTRETARMRSCSLRNSRSDFFVLRSKRSRNGRSPSGDAPVAAQDRSLAVLADDTRAVRAAARIHERAGILVVLVARRSQSTRGFVFADHQRSRSNVRASAGSHRTSLSSASAGRCAPDRSRRSAARSRAISTGGAVNGALCIMILSRAGTFTFQSPPSSASAQTSVAGSVARHVESRGPMGTPWTGTRSASGKRSDEVLVAAPGPTLRCRARTARTVTTYEIWLAGSYRRARARRPARGVDIVVHRGLADARDRAAAASTIASWRHAVILEQVFVVLARSTCRASRTCCSRLSRRSVSWMSRPGGHGRRRRRSALRHRARA